MALDDHNQDIEDFLDSMKQCFDDVDKALVDVSASIPLEYVESRLVDHFQIVNAIAIAIQNDANGESPEGDCRRFVEIFAQFAAGNPHHKE